MKFLNKIFFAVIGLAVLTACEEGTPSTEDLNYVGFDAQNTSVFLKAGESKEIQYDLYSTGSASDVAIEVAANSTLDASYYTVGALSSEGNKMSFTVNFANYDVTNVAGKSLVLKAMNNGGYAGSDLVISTAPDCPTLNLTFDNWAEEAAWSISNANGAVASGGIANGSFSGEYAGLSSATISLCELVAGNYTITVYDSYQDGGTSYSLTTDAGSNEVFSISGASYTFSTAVDFTIE